MNFAHKSLPIVTVVSLEIYAICIHTGIDGDIAAECSVTEEDCTLDTIHCTIYHDVVVYELDKKRDLHYNKL